VWDKDNAGFVEFSLEEQFDKPGRLSVGSPPTPPQSSCRLVRQPTEVLVERFGNALLPLGGLHGYVGVRGKQGKKRKQTQVPRLHAEQDALHWAVRLGAGGSSRRANI
jgi:hypothetical protein